MTKSFVSFTFISYTIMNNNEVNEKIGNIYKTVIQKKKECVKNTLGKLIILITMTHNDY